MPVYDVQFDHPLSIARVAEPGQRLPEPARGNAQTQDALEDASRREWQAMTELVTKVNQQMAEQYLAQRQLLEDLQHDLVELSSAIAIQIIGETEVSETRVQQLVESMLEPFHAVKARVFLHPEDCRTLHNALRSEQTVSGDAGSDHAAEAAKESSAVTPSFDTVPDATLERGMCRVEGPHYGYISNWKHQVAAVRQTLLEQLHE